MSLKKKQSASIDDVLSWQKARFVYYLTVSTDWFDKVVEGEDKVGVVYRGLCNLYKPRNDDDARILETYAF